MIVIHLQDILTERNMSRRELARRSGLNINTICKLANDANHMIDLTTLDQVCKTLQVQPGELLVRESGVDLMQCYLRPVRLVLVLAVVAGYRFALAENADRRVARE